MLHVRSHHTLVAAVLSAAALLVPATGASAASPTASCVALVTTFETQIAPGFVGDELKGLATAGGRDLSRHVTTLAQAHAGTIEGCFGSE